MSIAAVQPLVDPLEHSMPVRDETAGRRHGHVERYMDGSNAADAVFGLVMLIVQVAPLTEVQPVQLLKREPGAGSATSVMVPPFATEVEQPVVAPGVQLRPGPVTVPLAP
jgi:hypothetical protein